MGTEIEGIGDGVVGCWSGLFSGVDPEALDGCWVGEQLWFAKEGLPVRPMSAGFGLHSRTLKGLPYGGCKGFLTESTRTNTKGQVDRSLGICDGL